MLNYYTKADFACPHCGENLILDEVVDYANILARLTGLYPRISSGYRCREHNAVVGGVPDSAHVSGKAWDSIITASPDRRLYCSFAHSVGIVRIGLYADHLHLDLDETKPQGWWVGLAKKMP